MKYSDFEKIMSPERMNRYLMACRGSSRKAMALYRKNLHLSQELFTIISCFEVALRNSIDKHYKRTLGNNWLRNAAMGGGIYDTSNCRYTQTSINDAVRKLSRSYTHDKLVAELGFGFWRYMFAHQQFAVAGRTLLHILPAKPKSTHAIQYNHTYVFNQLAAINEIRNRIAHHEPICFQLGQPFKSTIYIRQHYALILQLFQWMSIDEAALLYGLDHINSICNQVDAI